MISIRLAIAAVLAVAAVLAGGSATAHRSGPAKTALTASAFTRAGGPVPCCVQ
jgi:hypothetical protein